MSATLRRRALVAIAVVAVAGASALAFALAETPRPGDEMLAVDAIDLSPLDRVPAADWEALARKRVYFGHMSVGYDLLAGIEEIRKRKPEVRLTITETDDLSAVAAGTLAHSKVGRNGDPAAKLADFERRMTSPGSESVDIALVKLCYIDVVDSTPVKELYANYESTIERLEAARPRTKFVRVSVPLTARPAGLSARIKRLAGRGQDHDADNRARNAFNDLMRSACGTKRPLLDLAAAESTLPGGERAAARIGGEVVPGLARCYTTDGGHLNDAGRLVAAREALLVLAEVAK